MAPPEAGETADDHPRESDAAGGADASDGQPPPDVVEDAEPETAPPGRAIAVAMAVATDHTCALLEDHRLKCWGRNGNGQLGLGDQRTRGLDLAEMGDALPAIDLGTGRRATAIAAGRYATCAILDSGALKCWGLGSLTGLGRADLVGDEPGEMGDNLPAVDLGPGRTARQVAIGYYNACVLRDDDTVRCWGTSDQPMETPSAAGTKVARLVGAATVLAILDGGGVEKALLPGGSNLAPGWARVDVGGPVRSLAGSLGVSCAILQGGGINCWDDISAIARPPMTPSSIVAMAISQFGIVCGLLGDGGVRCWGRQSPLVPTTTGPSDAEFATGALVDLGGPAVAVAGGGFEHTCALMKTGEVKCWAWNTKPVAAVGAGQFGSLPMGGVAPVDLGTRLR